MSDIRKIAASFHRNATHYDRHVSVQKRVVENLSQMVAAHLAREPERILDVGTGTGALLARLRSIYPASSLYGIDLAYNMCERAVDKLSGGCQVVNGTAEQLPFRDGTFDLVVSSSSLQWVADLTRVISEMRRVLIPGGTLCLAFFGEGTLGELQECFREAARMRCDRAELTTRLHRFHKVDDVATLLNGMDFEQLVIRVEHETDWYDDVTSLVRSIKNIGAGAVSGGGRGGLGWRGILQETSALYMNRFGQGGRIPATYRVLYLYARVPDVTRKQ